MNTAIIKRSWESIKPIQNQAGIMFYQRLFKQYPEVKPLFKTDTEEQASKLMLIIDFVINNLDTLNEHEGAIRQLAKRHNGYKVKAEHYNFVGESLIWTLEQGLGEAWNEELEEAWVELYTNISTLMKKYQFQEE